LAKCVAWRDDNGRIQWCAISSKRYDPKAWSDRTLCGHYVIMRVGSETRVPTYPECLRRLPSTR
jgi:hypothetical protein